MRGTSCRWDSPAASTRLLLPWLCCWSPWAVAPTGSQDGSILIPRYFQWVAAAPKLEKRLRGFWSQPGLILGVGSNCFGAREKRPGCVKKLRNRIKPSISGGYVSKARRLLNPGEIVVPTFQTPGLAGLYGNGTSRLLGATGRRGQRILKVNSLKTAPPLTSRYNRGFQTGHFPLLLERR